MRDRIRLGNLGISGCIAILIICLVVFLNLTLNSRAEPTIHYDSLTDTATPTATDTSTPTATATSTSTSTPTPTSTHTPTPTPTDTPTTTPTPSVSLDSYKAYLPLTLRSEAGGLTMSQHESGLSTWLDQVKRWWDSLFR